MNGFPDVERIPYEGPDSKNPLAFRWYDESEVVEGRTMREHLRFSTVYWHTFRATGADPFGAPTLQRPWDDGSDSVDNARERVHVAFELMAKLGTPYYAFHDRDVAPEGASLRETNRNLDAVVEALKAEQERTGIRLLWGTANLFSHPRYVHGAATSCNADAFAFAAAQVKKCMEVTRELGGQNYVFWGGREGYQSLLNTDMKRELDHLGRFLHMAVDHADRIGFDGTLLVEPKPKEPTKHQYDSDAAACINFLRAYGLTERFKLNIETNHATLAGHEMAHELEYAAHQGLLGSMDANTGDLLLGWDTDQFPYQLLPDRAGHADPAQLRRDRPRRHQLRRQGAARKLRADRPVPRPRRRHGRVRARAEDRRGHPCRRGVAVVRPGALRELGLGHRRPHRVGRGGLRLTRVLHAGERRDRSQRQRPSGNAGASSQPLPVARIVAG